MAQRLMKNSVLAPSSPTPGFLARVGARRPDRGCPGPSQRGLAMGLRPGAGLGRAGILRAPMSIVWASVIVIVVAAVAIAAMLLVRRRAPDGKLLRGR